MCLSTIRLVILVSILVLMEDSQRAETVRRETLRELDVSILVLMEDSQRVDRLGGRSIVDPFVSILVLMENSQRVAHRDCEVRGLSKVSILVLDVRYNAVSILVLMEDSQRADRERTRAHTLIKFQSLF